MDISENGIVVGYTTGFGLTGEYEGFVWTQEMGMISLSQYLKELYGLNLGLQNMRMPMKISDDGRVIAGYTMISGARIPYIITLDEEVLNTRPLLLVAKQEKDAMRVKLSWNLPIYNGKKILGYAIYRDSVKVNTDLITDCSYIDEGMPEGKHSYQITTIYASGESAMSDAVKVEVVGIGGCYSVKYIQSELVYNKTAKIHWGVPTSAISSASMPQFSLPNTFDEKTQIQPLALSPSLSSMKIQNSIEAPDTMDLVNVYGLKSNGVVSLVKLGDYYYGANINQAGFTKYSAQMEVLGVVKIPNLPAIWNITTDGQYIYCGATTKFIYKVDIAEGSIVAQYKTDEKVRHLCYIPQLDNGNGGFELGDWESSILVDKKGKKISEGLSLKNAFGTAYHKGYIYAHQQIGTGCLINQYDLNTKQFTNFSLDPTTYSEVKALVSQGAYAAGISVLTMEDSTICLVPVIQGNDGKNTAVFMELEAMPHLKGFNIYRNEQKLNTLPLSKRHFSEVLSIPGTYTYQVSAVFDNACESEKIDASPLNVEPILPCPSVKNLEVNEQNQNVYLRWVSPTSYSSSLLGYILYKDGQKEVDLFRKHIFIDTMVNIGLHTYTIEAFYENSCLAVDSIQIEVTHQGLCAAANYLKLESQQTTNLQFDVHASWELPYMETPLTLRYDNYENAMTVGFTGGGDPTVAVGWTAEQLATYNGFYLIGMEIFVEEGFSSLIPMVMVDEKVVYSKKADNVPMGQFTQLYFDQAIPIQTAKKELMVGYTIKHAEGTFPIGIGQTAVNKNYGDLFTLDLITWYSAAEKLGLTSNWNIAALLVKPRDVSKNSKWSASLIKPKEPVQIGSVTIDKLKLLEQKSKNSTYSTLDTLKLLGFDLYRDGSKINTERILDLQYTDKNLEKGNYQYLVNTIWNRCDEIPSKIAKITLSPTPIEGENAQKDFVILPNPAQNYLFIVGEYQRFEIINSYGQICMKGNAQKSSFSITNLNSGMYLVRIYTSSGQVQIRKLIIHK
ncbi:MAG: T9SS type A sorting domain-containing protein, partial [Bacteroidales bacterium]